MSTLKNQKNTKKNEKKKARGFFYLLDLYFAENHTLKYNKQFTSTGKRKDFTAIQRKLCTPGQKIQYVTNHITDVNEEYVYRKGKRRPLHIRVGDPFHIQNYLELAAIGKVLTKHNPEWFKNRDAYAALRWVLQKKFHGCEADTKLLAVAVFYYRLQYFKMNPIDEILDEFFPALEGKERTRMRKKIIDVWKRLGYEACMTKNCTYVKMTPRYLEKRLSKFGTGYMSSVGTSTYKKRQRTKKNLSYFENNRKKCKKIKAPPDQNYEKTIIFSKKSIFRKIVWNFINSKTEKRKNRKGEYYLYNRFLIWKDNGKKIIRPKFAKKYRATLKNITMLSDPRILADQYCESLKEMLLLL